MGGFLNQMDGAFPARVEFPPRRNLSPAKNQALEQHLRRPPGTFLKMQDMQSTVGALANFRPAYSEDMETGQQRAMDAAIELVGTRGCVP